MLRALGGSVVVLLLVVGAVTVVALLVDARLRRKAANHVKGWFR